MLRAQRWLGFPQGILVANPVPAGSEIPAQTMDGWIAEAQRDLASRGVRGKAVTPYLLGRIVELSGGRSLDTNVALFHDNVRLACDVAAAFAALHGDRS